VAVLAVGAGLLVRAAALRVALVLAGVLLPEVERAEQEGEEAVSVERPTPTRATS
jgi:hypothetical protein